MRETSGEVALMLRQLAEALEGDKAVGLSLAGESVVIPADADVRVEYERGGGAREFVVRVNWGLVPTAAYLVNRHGDQLRDSAGRLYDVLVYGEERADGTWEGWLEFAPRTSGLPAKRTGRETTQPDRDALEHWATGLEPLYLDGAFNRAS